eukprot:268855-Prorocentrum_lima.AAC.1
MNFTGCQAKEDMVYGSGLDNGEYSSACSTDKLHDIYHQGHRSMELKHGISVLMAIMGCSTTCFRFSGDASTSHGE